MSWNIMNIEVKTVTGNIQKYFSLALSMENDDGGQGWRIDLEVNFSPESMYSSIRPQKSSNIVGKKVHKKISIIKMSCKS